MECSRRYPRISLPFTGQTKTFERGRRAMQQQWFHASLLSVLVHVAGRSWDRRRIRSTKLSYGPESCVDPTGLEPAT